MMKFNKTVWNILVLFYPPSWILTDDPHCPSLDKWWVDGLKKGYKLEVISKYNGKFRGKRVWIANSPYCCGDLIPDDDNLPIGVLPSRSVMLYIHFKSKKAMKDRGNWKKKEMNRKIMKEIDNV